MKDRRIVPFFISGIALAAVLTPAAHAQGLLGSYTVSGGGSASFPSGSSLFNETSIAPLTGAATFGRGTNTFNGTTSGPINGGAVVSADAGSLSVNMLGTATSSTAPDGTPVNSAVLFMSGAASASFTDFVISSASGGEFVSGSINGAFTYQSQFSANTSASISLVGMNARITAPGGTVFSVNASTQSQSFTSDLFLFPVGIPFSMSMSLNGRIQPLAAGTRPAGGGTAQGGRIETLNINGTLSFGSAFSGGSLSGGGIEGAAFGSGPVFNLPPGFTVNSAQANIVNNQYLGPTLVTVVPEAGAGTLATIGGALFGVTATVARRRKAA